MGELWWFHWVVFLVVAFVDPDGVEEAANCWVGGAFGMGADVDADFLADPVI